MNVNGGIGSGSGRAAVEAVGRKKRIMILDDHPLVCEGIAALIREDESLEVMAMCYSVPDALKVLQTRLPDLLLLDLSLPKTSGLDVLKDLRLQYPALDVLVVSMHDESVYAEHVVRLGAKGYVMKQEASDKIVEAILHVLRGGIYASPNVLSTLLSRLSAGVRRQGAATGLESLATRELEIFTLIGEGLTAHEIAESLNISTKTVQTHREHIKEKLGLKTSSELNHAAWTWCRPQQ